MSASAASTLRRPLDLIRYAASEFQAASVFFGHGTDNALDEAAALVLGALQLPFDTPDLYLQAELLDAEVTTVLGLIRRRIEERVPVAYLLGRAPYAGHEFRVSPDVLVPRSPLAEWIAEHGQPWLSAEPQRILDLCTGSGALAVLLAMEFPEAQVDASDLSEKALAIAEHNVRAFSLAERIELLQGDGLAACQQRQYDLILTNPPYVPSAEYAGLPREYLHEPRMGLEAGDDGLDFVRRLLRDAPGNLKPGGVLICEVGSAASSVLDQFHDWPMSWVDFQHGGDGVFLIHREQIVAMQEAQDGG